ncbi:MAG: anaerobic ribonucleoside-triphosphate reductase activating protein [Clostridia bacterium]|nr:anaerobic ribonucleoside-triphosphate reductase activating protein [Clostridia bacterium]
MYLRVAGVVPESIVDGPGIRYTVFVQGCCHRCPGCHNPQTHPLDGGEKVAVEDLLKDIKGRKLLRGVTFSGGEPFLQPGPLAYLGRQVRQMGLTVITYTGFLFEDILGKSRKERDFRELLLVSHWLIDGPFVIQRRDWKLSYRGSSNQRIIDVPASLKERRTCILEPEKRLTG